MKTDFDSLRLQCLQLPLALRADPKRALWIFGGGQFGRDVCNVLRSQAFEVRGFIEANPRTTELLGLPVKRWDQLSAVEKHAQLVVGIYNRGMPLDQMEAIGREAGFKDILMPWHIYAQFEKQLGWRYWLCGRDAIVDQLDVLENSHAFFTDTTSKACLIDICRFRLGVHTTYGSFRHATNQYFNELTLTAATPAAIRYVDGGAYNGDTLIEFCGLHNISEAFLFEPDKDNFAALQKNLRTANVGAYCLPMALGDSYQILSFNEGNGEAGTIDSSGTAHIAAMALDDFLPTQSVDFIKLDVEGAEIAALQGAARLIERCRPTLAISFYHRIQDLWEIPAWLTAHCDNYDFALRQHFFNSFDSVLYAMPRKR